MRTANGKTWIDRGGSSHDFFTVPTATVSLRKPAKNLTVVEHYDVAADAKSRISLRRTKTKYFHVKAFSNGSCVLEPRVLVSPEAIPARTLKMLARSVAQLKQGKASAPIGLSQFIER